MEVKSFAILQIPEVAKLISPLLFEQNVFSEMSTLLFDEQYVLYLKIAY